MLNEVKRLQKLAGLIKEEEEKDYFEYLDETPQEVQDIVEKYADDMHLGYEKCQQLVDELEQVGWTCGYGLDGIPYELKPLEATNEGMSNKEFADAQEKDRLDKHPEKDKIKAIQDLMKTADDTSKMPADRDDARNKAYGMKLKEEEGTILTYDDVKPGDDVYVKSVDRYGEIASLGDVDEDEPETVFVRFGYFDKNPKEFPLTDIELVADEDYLEDDPYDPDMARDIKYDR